MLGIRITNTERSRQVKWPALQPAVNMCINRHIDGLPAAGFQSGIEHGRVRLVVRRTGDAQLETGERREGMFGSIYWWMVKLGLSAALAGGGVLLKATGFDVELAGNQSGQAIFLMRLFDAGIPMVTSAIAIWAVALFPITEEKAHDIRLELERRRGKAGSV